MSNMQANRKQIKQPQPQLTRPRGKRNQNKRNSKKNVKNGSLLLSKCSLKYALALSAPFDSRVIGVCNPSFRTMNTHKVSCQGSFTATIGSAGNGWVALTPCLGNNNFCAYYTTNTYTGAANLNILSANNALTTGVNAFRLANMPYSAAQLQSANGIAAASGVLVSMGVRITYTGTTLNEGGMYFSYVDNAHSTCVGLGNTDLTSRTEMFIRGVDRNPLELCVGSVDGVENDTSNDNLPNCYYPYSNGETNFNSNFTITDFGGISAAPPLAAIWLTGVSGNTFHVEVIQHIEYIGTLPSASYTPHDSDSIGGSKVQSAAAGLSTLKKQEPKHIGSAWPFMYKALATVAMGVAEVVIPQTANAVSNLLALH